MGTLPVPHLVIFHSHRRQRHHLGPLGLANLAIQPAAILGTANFDLAVNGTAAKSGGGSWSSLSDARLKKDIKTLNGALDRLAGSIAPGEEDDTKKA